MDPSEARNPTGHHGVGKQPDGLDPPFTPAEGIDPPASYNMAEVAPANTPEGPDPPVNSADGSEPPAMRHSEEVPGANVIEGPEPPLNLPNILSRSDIDQLELQALYKGKSLGDLVIDLLREANRTQRIFDKRVYESSRLSFVATSEPIARDEYGLKFGRIIP